MRIILQIIFFILIISLSCKKQKLIGDKYITLSYKQTSCADAWASGSNDSITLKNLANYLNSYNLYIASLFIKQDSGYTISCLACTCKTGKTIYVSTFDNDSAKAQYMRLGFK